MRRGETCFDAVARASNAPDSAWVSVSKTQNDRRADRILPEKWGPSLILAFALGCALLALRVLRVHLRVRAVGGRFGIADVHGHPHVGEHRTERREAEHHVVRAAGVAHEAEAPDLALERPEA